MVDIYEVPACDTHGWFFNESGRFASTPNSLAGPKSQVDESAVFSVLQFGAIIPPLSPWSGIRRLMPGYQYHGGKLVGPLKLERPVHVATLELEQQSDELERVLDLVLVKLIGDQPDPVLMFSGGVDSGFIASRLAALGYRDSLLLNYSFREGDEESQLAEVMAGRLGLRFERISSASNLCDCLVEPGRIYPMPFGDHSTVPTWDFAHAVADRLGGRPRLILDGTGADGAFGLVAKIAPWTRVTRVPAFVRRAASRLYATKLWHRNSKIEHLCRILRRSVSMPLMSAVLAQSPLAGVVFRDPAAQDVHRLFADWIGGWAGPSLPHRIVAADLALICANIFAQKAQPILESAGHKVCYPFLHNDTVSLALVSMQHWQADQPKAALKRSLARRVPREMVYRPKSGFVDPRFQVFFDAQFIAHLRAAGDSTSPIASLLNRDMLIKACDLLSRDRMLPANTRYCLWTVAFVDRWYRTALPGSSGR